MSVHEHPSREAALYHPWQVGSPADGWQVTITAGHATLPDGLTHLSSRAFLECKSLASVTCPSSLISIGDRAFDGCTSLASIQLPDGLTSVGRHAFDGCSSLASIDLPAGLALVGAYAFRSCVLCPHPRCSTSRLARLPARSRMEARWREAI